FFRHPAFFRAYFLFSLVPLALLAARDLAGGLRKNDERVWRSLFIIATLIAGGALISLLFLTRYMPPADVFAGMRWSGYGLAFCSWPEAAIASLILWGLPAHLRRSWLPPLFLILAAGDALLTSAISLRVVVDFDNVARWERLDRQHSTT